MNMRPPWVPFCISTYTMGCIHIHAHKNAEYSVRMRLNYAICEIRASSKSERRPCIHERPPTTGL